MASDRGLLLAYAAGVIDSDGTIGVHRKLGAKAQDGSHQDCYEPRVAVKQVDIEAIDLLSKLFGGFRRIAAPSGGKGRPLHDWRVTGRVACRALEELLPYLRIKKLRAENAIEVGRLNRLQKFRETLRFDDSEGLVTLAEAARATGKPRSALTAAVSRGQLPGVGWRRTRLVPLATAREWSRRTPGGPSRSMERTALLEQCYLMSKKLNRVGIVQ